MINFEEELAKYKPSKEIESLEDEILARDLTDMTDIMLEMMQQSTGKKNAQEKDRT